MFISKCAGNIKNNIIVKIENEIITDYEIKNKILTYNFLEISQ